MKNILKDRKLIFLSLFPISFLISSTFVNLIIILSSLFFILYIFKKNFFIWIKDKIFLILLLFYLYLIINHFVFSYDKELSLSRSLGFIRYILFVMAIKYYFWPVDKNLQNDVIKVWSYICIIVFLDSIFQFFTGSNILGFDAYKMGGIQRLSSFMGNEYKIGGFLLVFGLICFSHLTKQKYYSFIFVFLFTSSIALTGERSNFFIFIITISLFLIFFREKLIKKFIYVFLILLSLSITLNVKPFNKDLKYTYLKFRYIYFLDEQYPYKISDNKKFFMDQESIQIVKDKKNNQNFSINLFLNKLQNSNYYPHYYTAYQVFKDNIYFGTGLKTFRKICNEEKYSNSEIIDFDKKKCSTHPHNVILEFLSETGVLGLSLIIIFLILISYQNFKIFYTNHRNLILSSFLIILFLYFPILPRGSFFTSWNAGLFWMVVGINMSIIHNQINK